MKAWVVWFGEINFGCVLVHAETIGKAKLAGKSLLDGDDYLEMHARRMKGLDNKPINYQNAKDAGFQYTDGGYSEDGDGDGYLLPELFHNYCHCENCHSELVRAK